MPQPSPSSASPSGSARTAEGTEHPEHRRPQVHDGAVDDGLDGEVVAEEGGEPAESPSSSAELGRQRLEHRAEVHQRALAGPVGLTAGDRCRSGRSPSSAPRRRWTSRSASRSGTAAAATVSIDRCTKAMSVGAPRCAARIAAGRAAGSERLGEIENETAGRRVGGPRPHSGSVSGGGRRPAASGRRRRTRLVDRPTLPGRTAGSDSAVEPPPPAQPVATSARTTRRQDEGTHAAHGISIDRTAARWRSVGRKATAMP